MVNTTVVPLPWHHPFSILVYGFSDLQYQGVFVDGDCSKELIKPTLTNHL